MSGGHSFALHAGRVFSKHLQRHSGRDRRNPEYWKDVPANQAEVSFRSGEIYVAGPWFATEFRCLYRRRRTGEHVDARGAIFCETKGDKVSDMRMYWHRSP